MPGAQTAWGWRNGELFFTCGAGGLLLVPLNTQPEEPFHKQQGFQQRKKCLTFWWISKIGFRLSSWKGRSKNQGAVQIPGWQVEPSLQRGRSRSLIYLQVKNCPLEKPLQFVAVQDIHL